MEIRIYKKRVPKESAEIRKEVFCDEQGFIDEFDGFDMQATHMVMFDGDRAVATLRFYDEGNGSCHVGRVAVRKSERGKCLGKILMSEAFEIAIAEGYERMTVGAQADKSGFYASCGFEPTGEEYVEQGCRHVCMVKGLRG